MEAIRRVSIDTSTHLEVDRYLSIQSPWVDLKVLNSRNKTDGMPPMMSRLEDFG